MRISFEDMDEVGKKYWAVITDKRNIYAGKTTSKGGKKMLIRTRQEIRNHREMIKKKLEKEIERAVGLEETSDKYIATLNEELKFVSSEVPYEETLAGETERLEGLSFSIVNKTLGKLSKLTGKEYYIQEGS